MPALVELAFSPGPHAMIALTSMKVLLTVRLQQWRRLPQADRHHVVNLAVQSISRLGRVPLILYVAAALIYEEGAFPLLDVNNIMLVKAVCRCVKIDIELCAMEKLSRDDFQRRSGPVYAHWQTIVGSASKVLPEAPVGGPLALACCKILKMVLVDMNSFIPLSPSICGSREVGNLLGSIAKQLLETSQVDSRYFKACMKLLSGVLLGNDASNWKPLIEPIVAAFCASPRTATEPSIFRFLGTAFDHPELREEFVPNFLTADRIGRLLGTISQLLSIPQGDLIEQGSDFVHVLENDLIIDDDSASYLMLVLGRSKVKQMIAGKLDEIMQQSQQMDITRRAAIYEMHAACASLTTPFSMVAAVLQREAAAWSQSSNRGVLWAIMRACVRLVESFALSINTVEDYRTAISFLDFVLSAGNTMSIIPKVHACLALRSLVEWHRVPREQARAVLGSVNICQGVTQVFSQLYSAGPLEEDLTETTLLSLLPLQVEMLEHVPVDRRPAVARSLLEGYKNLWWQEGLPPLVKIELLHSLGEIVKQVSESVDPGQALLPLIGDVISEGMSSTALMSDTLLLFSLVVLRSKPTDSLRAAALSLLAIPGPTTLLDDVHSSMGLMALFEIESQLGSPSQDCFIFMKKIASVVSEVVSVMSNPFVEVVVIIVKFHALFKARLGIKIVDLNRSWFFNFLQEFHDRGPDVIKSIEVVSVVD